MGERTALVRRPSPRLGDGIVTHIERRPVDAALAARQHETYVAALESAGWRVRWLPPADDLPDGVFVEDTVVVCDDLAVLGRPRVPERVEEIPSMEGTVAELGLEVTRIDEGFLDGGDVLQVGNTVYAGRSARTNEDAICQLTRQVATRGRRLVPVALNDCLHLKTAMTALPDGSLIGVPELVDTSALPYLRVAQESAGAHVVVLGEKQVLVGASAPRTADQLTAEGYDVTVVDIGEFEKLEGCVTCLSVLVP
ncbi:dimethylargininase [Actinoallomurus iriomotensis]|uniref:N(G),N(G)-dimethylarginine dimethylaminohydrolase n=1 Tax=Actinoallomurus iriomotensis TaxID=478107 RepID=A0A9W6SCD3_9ACTN|nr:dimethylargininase [Actinoallomurus iriomotensis]GLY90017.1 N(G),N(G)-dimethylarginine dimethylaminohydrolase [Actinoallomurus iriomotensis]